MTAAQHARQLALSDVPTFGIFSVLGGSAITLLLIRLTGLPNESLVLLNPVWAYRIYIQSSTWRTDFAIAACLFWTTSAASWPHLAARSILGFDHVSNFAVAGLVLAVTALYYSSPILRREQNTDEMSRPLTVEHSSHPRTDRYPLPPLLIPARTTHTRFFPKKHSFSYSYFYVGIPIGWKGRAGTSLSADVHLLPHEKRSYGWFNVDSKDYLGRGSFREGLEGKLRTYLQSLGIRDEDWSFAYLCTAPRFLGYSFNPVSFWYIYDSNSTLTMMVLEVNNTFGERRMYLLKAGEGLADGDGDLTADATRFRTAWTKDFHVSPFNSRKGEYSLQAKDPHSSGDTSSMAVNNVITLRSSKGATKLVARVFSSAQPLDPLTLTSLQLTKLIATWCFVGFLTFPRILYEAYRLFFTHKLHVWYRPEPLPSSISRSSTANERCLEPFVRGYLQHLVLYSSVPLQVTYIPPRDIGEPETWPSNTAAGSFTRCELKVLSPVFYTRFVHYAHTKEALTREGLCAEEKNRTVLLSDPASFDACLSHRSSDMQQVRRGAFAEWRWEMLKRLRCAPAAVTYSEGTVGVRPGIEVSDIRARSWSGLDKYVRDTCKREEAEEYRRIVSKAFLAQRYALGLPELVTGLDWALRAVLLLVACRVLAAGGFTGYSTDNALPGILAGLVGWFAAYGVHLWAFVKGS